MPVEVSGLYGGVTAISVGGGFACAILTGGGVTCWGSNTYGALGEGSPLSSRFAPWPVSGLSSGILGLSAGGNLTGLDTPQTWGHACAVTAVGSIMCWGLNSNGQLGNRSTTGSSAPVYVVTVPRPHVYLPLVVHGS